MATFSNSVTGDENAIEGVSENGRGVVGRSETNYGLRGHSNKLAGIRGSSDEGRGVEGWSTKAEGVVGISTNSTGVWGQTEGAGTGVAGTSKTGYGVAGESQKSAGVRGTSTDGRGVEGWSTSTEGVVGISTNSTGVWGQTEGVGIGIAGTSRGGVGVYGKGGQLAGRFEGDVEVTGKLTLQGVDVVALLRRLQTLEPLLAELESLRAAGPRLTSVQQISRPQSRTGGIGADFSVRGENFRPGTSVHILFHSSNNQGGSFQSHQVFSEANGTINVQVVFFCSVGTVFRIAAVDETSPHGALRSNTVTGTCRDM